MKYQSLKILDDILQIISTGQNYITYNDFVHQFHTKYPDLKFELSTLLAKLKKDEYIIIAIDESSTPGLDPYSNEITYNDCYTITLDGAIFLEKGGYYGKLERKNSNLAKAQSDIDLNKTIQYVIATTGAISAIYYLLEIFEFKNGELYYLAGILIFMIFFSGILANYLKFTTMQNIIIFIMVFAIFVLLIKYNLDFKPVTIGNKIIKTDTSIKNIKNGNGNKTIIKKNIEHNFDTGKFKKVILPK